MLVIDITNITNSVRTSTISYNHCAIEAVYCHKLKLENRFLNIAMSKLGLQARVYQFRQWEGIGSPTLVAPLTSWAIGHGSPLGLQSYIFIG